MKLPIIENYTSYRDYLVHYLTWYEHTKASKDPLECHWLTCTNRGYAFIDGEYTCKEHYFSAIKTMSQDGP